MWRQWKRCAAGLQSADSEPIRHFLLLGPAVHGISATFGQSRLTRRTAARRGLLAPPLHSQWWGEVSPPSRRASSGFRRHDCGGKKANRTTCGGSQGTARPTYTLSVVGRSVPTEPSSVEWFQTTRLRWEKGKPNNVRWFARDCSPHLYALSGGAKCPH